MPSRKTQTVEEWTAKLDQAITYAEGWLSQQNSRSTGEFPSVNSAKQLVQESIEFATCVSSAIKGGHRTAAYANLRPLLDRLLHTVWFFENLERVLDWYYWSMAEMATIVDRAMSQKAINAEDREEMRKLARHFRVWNQTASGEERKLEKPNKYDWHRIRRDLLDESEVRLKVTYEISSTYLHPTYRGDEAQELREEYALELGTWMLCITTIISSAQVSVEREDISEFPIDDNLDGLMRMSMDALNDPTYIVKFNETIRREHGDGLALHAWASMIANFVGGTNILEGLPEITRA